MAVTWRAERKTWRVQVQTEGSRVTRDFRDHDEAIRFESAVKADVALAKRQLNRELIAAVKGENLGHLVLCCEEEDWRGKDQCQFKNAVRLTGFLGADVHPGNITTQSLDVLVRDLRAGDVTGSELGNTTIRKYLSALQVMLKRAIRKGWIETLPLFPEGRTLPLPEPRDLVIEDEWLECLVDQFEKKEQRVDAALTMFIRQMGCRVGEALNLSWERVSFKHKTVQFIKTKGNAPRRLTLPDSQLKALKAMKERRSPKVFPISYGAFSKHYADAKHHVCAEHYLSDVIEKEWCIHTLRHTRITELAMNGFSAPQIQFWAGHRSLAMSQRYIHAVGMDTTAMANC